MCIGGYSLGHRHCTPQSDFMERTFVLDQPRRKAASCANNSPNPSINPLTKGRIKLIAAPRKMPQIDGGLYGIRGELDADIGDETS